MSGDLVVAIDLSREGSFAAIAIVVAEESVLKTRKFQRLCSGLKHFRRVGSDRKSSYLRRLPKKLEKLQEHLVAVRVVDSGEEAADVVDQLKPALVVVDDKLYHLIDHRHKIRESSPKPRYLNNLLTIADNLANYFRLLKKSSDKSKLLRELRRFEK